MVKKGRPPKKVTFDELPEALRFAIIKMMSKFNIKNFEKAYEWAAIILDPNCDEFEKLVNQEAERKYRSRHFTELNKARNTIHWNGFRAGSLQGENKGIAENRIWYFCAGCGKVIYVTPNSPSHTAIIKYMRDNGWSHKDCLGKSSRK